MPDNPQARWTQIEGIVDRALDLPPDERSAFVRQACGDDEALRQAVDEWLAGCENPSLVPDTPAAVFAAQLLTGPDAHGDDVFDVQQIGPYRIVRELGRGGMGAVYLAERVDGELDMRVAVKLMRRGTSDDASLRRRFRDERQILARLEHPNIASLIDGGVTPDGRLFFVMQYIEGMPIDRYCDEHGLPVNDRLRLFVDVCAAVRHAHDRQVIHRDLKPGNILVTADGQAKLLDFGIAKLLEGSPESAEQTRTGERLLTPEYASPEQIRGEPVTPASDVHALGVLLHRLLTGRRPFVRKARTPHELEQAILDEEPTQPSDAVTGRAERRRLRGDLDAIVLTALRKDPAKRYADAGAFATDVDRHLSGLPVQARGRAPGYRLRSFAGRHRGILAAAAVGMILGATALAIPSRRSGAASEGTVLAIGRIADYRAGGSRESAAPLVDMLATNLARTEGLAVISAGRMNELVRLAADPSNEDYLRAARQAGATELLSGALYSMPDGGVRFDLQRVDVTGGTIHGAHSASGADLFAVADSMTIALAMEMGLAPPPGSVTDVTTRSLVAYGHYVEGVRLFQAGATTAADVALAAALRADSTFAMAALYYARNSGNQWRFASPANVAREEYERRFARALRLAEKTSDRERLMIRMYYELFHSSSAMSAVAETLAVRYPQEIDGHLMVGISLTMQGRLREAIPHYTRIMAMDSVSLSTGGDACAGCVAIDAMIEVLALLDSMTEAEGQARRWLALQPASANARSRLAQMLDGSGRHAEAMNVMRAGAFAGNTQDSVIALAKHWIRSGELTTADSLLSYWIGRGRGSVLGPLLYFRSVVLRNQGRYDEALSVARRFRMIAGGRASGAAAPLSAMVEAQTLYELGRWREAAALFAQISRWQTTGQAASVQTVLRIQALAMMAASLHAAGDTNGLAVLADSLERDGQRSAMFRAREQHHFVRGLLLEARGDDDAAVAEFEEALHVSACDFGRVNLALAAIHMEHNRPAAAIEVLRPAARGWFLETTNLHISLTEVHERLAEAFDALGMRDSAVVHSGRASRALQ